MRSVGSDYTFTKSISNDLDHWFRSDVRNLTTVTAGNLFLLYTCAEHRLYQLVSNERMDWNMSNKKDKHVQQEIYDELKIVIAPNIVTY